MTEVMDPCKTLTLKFFHGGTFVRKDLDLCYTVKQTRTVPVDPDEKCWFTLIEEAEKFGFGKLKDAIFYRDHSVGLKIAKDDTDTGVMTEIGLRDRVVECYLVDEKEVGKVLDLIEALNEDNSREENNNDSPKTETLHQLPSVSARKKLTQRRGPPASTSKDDSVIPPKNTKAKKSGGPPSSITEVTKDSSLTCNPQKPCRKSIKTVALKASKRTQKKKPPSTHQILRSSPIFGHNTTNLESNNLESEIGFDCNDISLSDAIRFSKGGVEGCGYDTLSEDDYEYELEYKEDGSDDEKGLTDLEFSGAELSDVEGDKEVLGTRFVQKEILFYEGGVRSGSNSLSDDDNEYEPDFEDEESDDENCEEGDLELSEELSDTEGSKEVLEIIAEEEIQVDDNFDFDDEFLEAREKVKEWNSKALKIAKQLQLEAIARSLPGQQTSEGGAGGSTAGGVGGSTAVVPTGGSAAVVATGQGSKSVAATGYESGYDESGEGEDTPGESEDECIPGKRKKSGIPTVNDRTDFTKLKWTVGIRFPSREIFRDCVTRYAVAQGRNVKVSVSSKAVGQKIGVRCVEGCPFSLYESWDRRRGCFVVKSTQPEHSCQRTMESNKQLKSTWLAKQLLDVFKSRPHWPAAEIIETVRRAYKVLIRRGFAYKVKYHAHRLLHGSMKDPYSKIGSYIAALEEGDPLGVFTLFTNPTLRSNPPVFQRLFVCFDALKDGWRSGCRKVLCVDACFLKTFLGGQLISAVGRDANEQMYPLAWAVVEGENNESYEWFFKELKRSLDERDGEGWTIISDEHLSIVAMVAKEFPKAEHRHCARHIFANWHKSYKGDEMKLLFWRCAKAYNKADYKDAIEAMKEVDPKAVEAFLACKPELFCRAFLKTDTKADVIVSNMAETFNAYIINARSKHVIYMLEDIRVALMQRLIKKKREKEKKISLLCPRVQEKLDEEKELAAFCEAIPSTPTLYQVQHGIDFMNVDLEAKTCTCRKWNLTGIPCCHGVAAIFEMHAHPEEYVSDWYKRDTYIRAYSVSISPVAGQRHWPEVEVPLSPPPIKIGPGSPRKKRRRDPFEDPKKSGKLTRNGVELTCSICKSKTHNKRTCPAKDRAIVSQEGPKRGRGRPRKYPRIDASDSVVSSNAENHHEATAQPTRVGRGGRFIRGGRGARGGRVGRGGRVTIG